MTGITVELDAVGATAKEGEVAETPVVTQPPMAKKAKGTKRKIEQQFQAPSANSEDGLVPSMGGAEAAADPMASEEEFNSFVQDFLGNTKEGKDVNMFVKGIEDMVSDAHDKNFFEHAGDYVTDICALACRHHVKLDSIFITTALTLKLIEGTAIQLDPTVSLIEMGLPMAVSNKVRSYLKLKSLNFLS